MAKAQSHKLNFTLIEMLVVIAIISVLAAMLAPALRNAIKTSEGIQCANNFKQIGIAAFNYASNNNDVYVSGVTKNASGGYLWKSDENCSNTWYVQLWPYLYDGIMPSAGPLPTQSFFICPGSQEDIFVLPNSSPERGITNLAWNAKTTVVSGTLNSNPKKINRCKTPSQISVMWDILMTSRSGTTNIFWECQKDFHAIDVVFDWFPIRHNSGDNHLFVDGHVQNLAATEDSNIFKIRYAGPFYIVNGANPFWP